VPADGSQSVVNLVVEEPEVHSEGWHGNAALAIFSGEEALGARLARGLAGRILEITDGAFGADTTNTFRLAEAVLASRTDFTLLPIGVLAYNAAGTRKDTLGGISRARFLSGVTVCAGGARGTAVPGLVAARTTGFTRGTGRLGLEGTSVAVKALPLARNRGETPRSAILADARVLRRLSSSGGGSKLASSAGIAPLAIGCAVH
jgi:hypothetical protein